MNGSIGFLKSGSIGDGFLIRLNKTVNSESLQIGDFIVVQGDLYDYFGIIEDIRIGSSNEDVFFNPPENKVQRIAVKGAITFSEVLVTPYLMIEKSTNRVVTIKTIPEHFSDARKANERDIRIVFGGNAEKAFHVGSPLTMDERIYIDLEKLAKRNNAIFGITGSGKTFLGRIIFSGLIKHDVASLLIFDMHNEYGQFAKSEKKGKLKSLKGLFGTRVKVFDVSDKNDGADDFIKIPYGDIAAADIAMLSFLLSYSQHSEETAWIINKRFGDKWLKHVEELRSATEAEIEEKAKEWGVNSSSLSALVRHLDKLLSLDFIQNIKEDSSVQKILRYLKNGTSVVVQFSGKYANNPLAYFTVANIITRRIHELYASASEEERNKRIMIVVEEAHKLLSSDIKDKNIFGTIAREMRKYNVTLFVIDQRPSEIDSEVLSQVGTRFVMQLMDEKDMDAVFQGVGGGSRLKKILRTLQPQEVLLFGYAVMAPVPMRVREYNESFFKEVSESVSAPSAEDADELY